jgi:tetratricopeptide (TPR) repeat protein
MYAALCHYKTVLRERLWWYRASRILALSTQRLWRGFKGRSVWRRLFEMKRLPSPTDIRNHDFWEKLQSEAHPPAKELGIYAEYTLSGTPKTWSERNLVKRNGMYRDVVFYANTITKRATWTQPKGWKFKDHREYYILRLENFWRARVARRKIRLLAKARTLLENAHSKELANTKQDITSLCNFALYAHVVRHDYDTAREAYAKILVFMSDRGVDNAFVLYSYAIFGAVTNEEDWSDINDYIRRGKVAEELMQKRRCRTPPAPGEPKSVYAIARGAFYLEAVGNENEPAESWHNYALCQMLVYGDLQGARESFHRAIIVAPHDRRIISNFNALLQRNEYLGLSTNAHEEYLALIERKITPPINPYHIIF